MTPGPAEMRRALALHPDCGGAAAAGVAVIVARPAPGALALHYVVTGAIARLSLPPAAAAARADRLWRHTCFEAFLRREGEEGYVELNFAPSRQWAAYRFDSYRRGMRPAEIGAPRIETRSDGESFELRAELDLPGAGPWRAGLSAVIEEKGGGRSFWALAHPAGPPDFHHRDCFALELPVTP